MLEGLISAVITWAMISASAFARGAVLLDNVPADCSTPALAALLYAFTVVLIYHFSYVLSIY
jgi:hypothetical protein